MCKAHGCKDKFCELCDQNLKSEQSVIIQQLWERIGALETKHPELQGELQALEKLFPVTGIEVLEVIPYGTDYFKYWEREAVGPARGELREAVTQLVDRYSELRCSGKGEVLIGANKAGFFIYRKMKK